MSLQIGSHLTAFHVAAKAEVLLYLKNEFQLELISEVKKTFHQTGFDRDARKEIDFELELNVLKLSNGSHSITIIQNSNWEFLLAPDASTKAVIEKIVSRLSRKIVNMKYNIPQILNEGLDISTLQQNFTDFEIYSEKSSFHRSFKARRTAFAEISFNFVSDKSLGERGYVGDDITKSLYNFFVQVIAPTDQLPQLTARLESFFSSLGLTENP